MSRVFVYRVEHSKTGIGPYHSVQLYNVLNPHFSEQHPTPASDGVEYTDDHVFGFQTLDDLEAWFCDTEVLLYLVAYGFEIKVYRPKEKNVVVGGRQVAFIRPKKQKPTVVPWTDILEF